MCSVSGNLQGTTDGGEETAACQEPVGRLVMQVASLYNAEPVTVLNGTRVVWFGGFLMLAKLAHAFSLEKSLRASRWNDVCH